MSQQESKEMVAFYADAFGIPKQQAWDDLVRIGYQCWQYELHKARMDKAKRAMKQGADNEQ